MFVPFVADTVAIASTLFGQNKTFVTPAEEFFEYVTLIDSFGLHAKMNIKPAFLYCYICNIV